MGNRINYHIGHLPSAILYSNSHHDTECPEAVFRQLVEENHRSQTNLTRALLNARYQTDSGQHRAGDSIFIIDLEPGDREKLLCVTFTREGSECTATIKELDPAPEVDDESDGGAALAVDGEVVALLNEARKTIHGLAPGRFTVTERIESKLATMKHA